MILSALILAGGASRRMGQPKALLRFEGETFVDRLIGVFERHCSSVVVVAGHHADAVRAGIRRRALIAVNPDPERGQLSSMQCGLRVMPACDAFFFTPVDYPAIQPATVERLAEAMKTNAPMLAIPRCGGKRGHPVACRAALRDEFLALGADGQARDVVHSHLADALYLDVDDPGISTDIDNPSDYERLLAATRAP